VWTAQLLLISTGNIETIDLERVIFATLTSVGLPVWHRLHGDPV
jgi:hypothetical protein